MSCDSNDELKLTKDYKYLLSYIRPLIDQLDKSRDAQLCLLWLSKLEQCSSWEKHYRNKILTELCKQVKSNCLKSPFNSAPPSGPLRNIIRGGPKGKDRDYNEYSEAYASTEEVFSSSSHKSLASIKNVRKQVDTPPWKASFVQALKSKPSKQGKDVLDHSECVAIQKAYQERAQSDQMVIERYQDIIKSLVSEQLKADNSPRKAKKLQSTYESKITELKQSLEQSEKENEILKAKLTCFEGNVDMLESIKNENESLRKQIFELEKEKNSLQSKCKQVEDEKLVSLSDLISKLNESEKMLKESERRFKSLEMKHEENCRNFELECQTRVYEKQKHNLERIKELEQVIEEKQTEVENLKEQLNNQSFHFGQEISRLKQQIQENLGTEKDKEKIKNLKIKAKKLEKVKEHMTVLFQSQMQQILAKKDFYIASLEMQLKMNNSDSSGNVLNSDFHNSLDQKISNLEAQYKKLLEDSEQRSIERRQLDLQKIHALEKQLLQFGGAVAENESVLDEMKPFLTPDAVPGNNSNAVKKSLSSDIN